MNETVPAASRKGKLGPFAWDDPLLSDDLLTEDERAIRDAARAYARTNCSPACSWPTGTSISTGRS